MTAAAAQTARREPSDKVPLRVLSVEDSEDDWLLVLRALDQAGYDVRSVRVQTAAAMRQAMQDDWDLVVSDFQMPEFTALGALEVLKASGRDLPFIIASGTIGEAAAVTALKAGAHDFVLKGQLARFVPAVTRELRDAALRRERRRMEAALTESENRYRRIVETAQEGIWMLDAEGRTTFVNRRMAELLGGTAEQLKGSRLADFALDAAAIQGATATQGEARRAVEVELLRQGGARFWASVSSVSMVDEQQRLGLLATVVDVTEQRRLTEQLLVSDRMASVGTLAAGVAHEINNPLAVILSNVETAAQSLAERAAGGLTAAEVAELNEELADVRDAAQRVRDIVRDLKVFSHGDDARTGPVDLAAVIDSALRLARNELRHKAALVRDIPDLPRVQANEGRLAQVFVNLLVNAAQAIPDGQAEANTIRVGARLEGKAAVVEIADSGSGMTPEVLHRLFTPFFTTKPVGVGTGLGLAICHRIITAMNGEISATTTPGKGSTFHVRLPLAVESAANETPTPATAGAPLPARRETVRGRVLVVDDEPTIGITLRRVLGATHHVEVRQSARTALAQLEAGERYDVILCDLMMPDMTGAHFQAALLRRDPAQAGRIIFLTGGVFTAEMQAFLAASDHPVIEKPFELERVRSLVDDAVQKSRSASHPPAPPA